MPLLADRVRETTTTTGQGTLTLDGAPSGFRTFSSAFGNGVSVYYVIAGPSEWEIGIGTTGAGTLTRDTVLVSSAGGTTKVTFSAGTKDVFCSYVADRAVTTSDASTLTNKTIDDYTNNVGANSTHFRVRATGTLAKGAVVKATGFNVGEQAIRVGLTSSASDVAIGVMEQDLTTGQFGMAVVIGELFDVNTSGLSVGATLYSDNAGGYTTTKPSSGFYQSLGWVVRANSTTGVIAVNIVAPLYVETSTNTANTAILRDGSGNFAAGTITAALTGNASTASALTPGATINGVTFTGASNITVAAAAGTLTGSTLASGVTASSLTSVGTLTSLTVTSPSAAAPFAVNSNNANGVYYDIANAQNSSSFRIAAYGTTAFGVSALISRAAIEGNAPNGMVVGAVTSGANGGPIEFHTGFRVIRWSIGASTGHLLAGTDNTYDIGASGATRPRDLFLGRDATVGRNITLAGKLQTSFSSSSGNSEAWEIRNTQPNASHYFSIFQLGTGGLGVPGWASSTVLEANNYLASSGDKSFVFSNYVNTGATYNFVWQIGNRTSVWAITGGGHFVCPTDNTYDIGASGATRPRDLFIGRNADHGGWMRAGAASAGAASTTTIGNGTSTTVGASGAASALPANPLGYLIAHVGTTQVKIPYYTA